MIKSFRYWWAFIPLFILLVAYSNLFLDPTQPLKFFLLSSFLFIANGFFLWHVKKINHSFLGGYFIKVYGFYIALSCASLFYSNSVSNGIYELLKTTLFFNFLLLGAYYFQNKKSFKLTPLSYLFTLFQLFVVIGILTSFASPGFKNVWLNSKPYAGLFLNPNLTSQLLLFSSVLPVFTILHSKHKVAKSIQAVVLIISLVLVLVIGSKTIYIAIAIFLFTSLFFWLGHVKKVGKKVLLAGILVMLVVTSLVAYKFYPKISEISSFQHRKELWLRTAGIIQENPVWGEGIGSWHINNLYHIPERSIRADAQYETIYSPEGNIFYERPHNDFLWIWSEIGLLGLISYLLLFGVIFYYGRFLISKTQGEKRTLYVLLLSGVSAYLIVALFSFPKERIEQSLFLMLFSGFILSGFFSLKTKKSSLKLGVCMGSILLVISGFSVYWAYQRLEADYYLRNVVEAKRNNSWRKVLRETKKAERTAYVIAGNGTPVNWFKGTAQIQLGLLDEAHLSFKNAFTEHPTHIFVLNNLATTYTMKGEVDSAITLYQEALRVNPVYEDPLINLSGIYFNREEYELAWESISKVPLNSRHWKYKVFANTILENRFKKSLITAAKERNLENIEAFLSSKEAIYFIIYVKSKKDETTMEGALISELEAFNELNILAE